MPKDGYSINAAAPDDIEALADLVALVFSLEKDFRADRQKQTAGLKMLLADSNSRVFVLRHSNLPVGMCTAQLIISTAEGGYKALVEDVAVAPGHRGKQWGRKLLAAAGDWAKAAGARRLDLAADKGNADALAFYHKTNWQKTNLVVLQKKI
ncbi:MAG: GNAT family N-acetyltransferase [Acidaminococcales bacterium]|jgi:GNAT superfamily N-acetyltransferase|nr:GNAT family N-acetyltransferase [Acidaminococcales bacterium]